jgi:hypothetical protein
MPVDRKRYSDDWEAVSQYIRFERAGSRCEWPGCTARHGEVGYWQNERFIAVHDGGEAMTLANEQGVQMVRVCLTTAHLPIDANGIPCDVHDKKDCSEFRLLALCNRHHLRLDAQEHATNAARTRRARHEALNPILAFEETGR